MEASKVKQVRHAQQAYTFCYISTIMKVKFINEWVTFCAHFDQVFVAEADMVQNPISTYREALWHYWWQQFALSVLLCVLDSVMAWNPAQV